jgi:hypothetical protein
MGHNHYMITHDNGNSPTEGNGERLPDVLDDQRGAKRHIRRYARDIVKILRFERESGEHVFEESEIVDMLRGAVPLINDAVGRCRQREYAAVMKILLEASRREKDDENVPKNQVNIQNIGTEGGVKIYLPDNGRNPPSNGEVD